jgi:hypothetical protein
MKLRIHGNSLRLRLNQQEVAALWKNGRVENSLQFSPGAQLTYSLEADADTGEPYAAYENGHIRVRIPKDQARAWASSEETGIYYGRPGEAGLALAVEKDFRCLHRSAGEEQEDADAFPNPLMAR